jgi:hypothetical protein
LFPYGATAVEEDTTGFDRWLAQLASRYDQVDRQRHAFPMHYKDRDLLYYEYLDLYEFVPKGHAAAARRFPYVEQARRATSE